MKIVYILLPISFIFSSCSSNPPKRPEPEESFVTHITEDGTKKFSFSLTSNNSRGGKNKGGGPGGRGSGKGGGQGRGQTRGGPDRNSAGSDQRGNPSEHKFQMKERFIKRLEKNLFEKQYCHEGYSEIDSYIDREMSQYKGQCQEKANKEDLVNFPNQ